MSISGYRNRRRYGGSSITTVGMYDGERFTCLVKGQDLDEFPDVIARYGMIVTFFAQDSISPCSAKRSLTSNLITFILIFATPPKSLGIRGGLKKIEKQFGIGRTDETDGLNGLDAIRLWREYQWAAKNHSKPSSPTTKKMWST
ncbi:MAG: ribonuclease H-like domain-containing protein [Fimbriimonadaceae bacterium]